MRKFSLVLPALFLALSAPGRAEFYIFPLLGYGNVLDKTWIADENTGIQWNLIEGLGLGYGLKHFCVEGSWSLGPFTGFQTPSTRKTFWGNVQVKSTSGNIMVNSFSLAPAWRFDLGRSAFGFEFGTPLIFSFCSVSFSSPDSLYVASSGTGFGLGQGIFIRPVLGRGSLRLGLELGASGQEMVIRYSSGVEARANLGGPYAQLNLIYHFGIGLGGGLSHQEWQKRGNELYRQGRVDDALEAYDKSLQLNSNNPALIDFVGKVRKAKGPAKHVID